MARTIHCTVVEVPAMADPYLPAPRQFNDLVPWADPYITLLLHKLCRTALAEDTPADSRDTWNDGSSTLRGELPPPLDKDDREKPWQPDWSQRNWPRG